MKLAEFKINGLVAAAVVIIIAYAIALPITGSIEFKEFMDKPIRDMTIGHAVVFLMVIRLIF